MRFKPIVVGLFTFSAGMAGIVSAVPTMRELFFGGGAPLAAADRKAIAAEVRAFAADGLVAAEERAALSERVAILDLDEELAQAYVAEIEPAMLRAGEELREGRRLVGGLRFAEARRRFAEATRLDAGNAEAWANLGGAALEDGAIAEAEAASRRALGLDAKSVTAHYNLAACLARQERAEVALDHLERALDLVIDGAAESVDRGALVADLRGSDHFATLRPLPRFTALVRRLADAEG